MLLLNCSSGFQAKKLGKKLVPQQSRSWLQNCVSKIYAILQAKWLQSKVFVSALYDAKSDIRHTLLNGHRDPFWAYFGVNKHGFLLKQLQNNKIKNNQLYIIYIINIIYVWLYIINIIYVWY